MPSFANNQTVHATQRYERGFPLLITPPQRALALQVPLPEAASLLTIGGDYSDDSWRQMLDCTANKQSLLSLFNNP